MHTEHYHIAYDQEMQDFAMYLDGELVGFARTYQDAEATLAELLAEIRARNTAPQKNITYTTAASRPLPSTPYSIHTRRCNVPAR